jgi:PAS domain S-box-containing protein
MADPDQLIARYEEQVAVAEQQKAQADALFHSIGEGAIATDVDGKIYRVNQTALDLLGYREHEVLGKWFPRVIVAENDDGVVRKPIDRAITRAFLLGKAVTDKTFYRTKSGKLLPVFVTVSPIILNDSPIGAIEVFRDITLEHNIDKMKSEFISIASHQLRTPLSAIKTYSHLLAEGYVGQLTPEQIELMQIILTSIGRMNELIDTLLDVTKIEAGKLGLDLKMVKLGAICQEIIDELKQYADLKHITLKTDIDTKLETMTDPLLAKEVFANLLSNAIKYTPDNGTITLRLRGKGNMIVYSVQDTGLGIPEGVQDRIFTKFFRAPNVVRKETSGTGLGLYLVKSIVDNLGGKVWFKSKENQGSTFYFELPLATMTTSKNK